MITRVRVALQADPLFVFPDAQLLVDAFARHPDHVVPKMVPKALDWLACPELT